MTAAPGRLLVRRNLVKHQMLFASSFAYSCTRVLSNMTP